MTIREKHSVERKSIWRTMYELLWPWAGWKRERDTRAVIKRLTEAA